MRVLEFVTLNGRKFQIFKICHSFRFKLLMRHGNIEKNTLECVSSHRFLFSCSYTSMHNFFESMKKICTVSLIFYMYWFAKVIEIIEIIKLSNCFIYLRSNAFILDFPFGLHC